MSDHEDTYAVIRRERETETKIRAMDAADIVELVHGFEDEIDELEAKLAAAEAAVPVWLDPYTNNGDRRYDTEYRQGWNACRDAMLATTEARVAELEHYNLGLANESCRLQEQVRALRMAAGNVCNATDYGRSIDYRCKSEIRALAKALVTTEDDPDDDFTRGAHDL